MELYLVIDQIVKFGEDPKEVDDFVDKISDLIPVTLEPVAEECEDSKGIVKFLKSNSSNNALTVELNGSRIDYSLRAILTVPFSTSVHGKIVMFPGVGASLIDKIVRLFKRENLSFNLTIKDLNMRYSCGCTELLYVEANDVRFEVWHDEVTFDKIKFPEHRHLIPATLDGEKPLQFRLTFTVTLNKSVLTNLQLEESPSKDRFAEKYKKLLDEAVASDLVVVAANGVEVKCHKNILMVSSDVFRAMFERSKMKEEISNRLEMVDMSEEVVRAFLNFIYWSDVKAARENCDIALELFRAGDMYGISSLQTAMKSLICSKGVEWFNVGMAVRLSLLIQDFKEKEEILKKVAQVLKWYSKNSSAELLASEEYQELFQNDPKIAMKLVSLFLEFS